MTKFTKEQLQQIIETDHVQCGDAAAMARQLLAGIEQEPVAYMYKDRLHTDARFSLHTRFGNWSQEDISEYEITEIPLYAAPQLPQPAVPEYLENLRSLVADKRALPRRKEWVSGQQYSYVLLENVEGLVEEACRAAMLQGGKL